MISETRPAPDPSPLRGDVPLIISVDTEEDDWGPARGDITVENIRDLPRFQVFMERLNLKPTYLTSYQVAATPWAAAILRDLAHGGSAEVAAHLHPWNTPPLDEPLTGFNTVTKNLPAALQRRKLEVLTRQHGDVFGVPPLSFRTGRYGLGTELLGPLLDLGYRVDSSVTPYYSWEEYDNGSSYIGAPTEFYRLGPDARDVNIPAPSGALQEVPVSCGYNRRPFEFWNSLDRLFRRPLMRQLHAPGFAWRTHLLRRILLSPEVHDVSDMLVLSRRLLERGVGFLNLTLHSSSLAPTLTPFTATPEHVDRLLDRTEEYVNRLAGFVTPVPATLAEFAAVSVTAQ